MDSDAAIMDLAGDDKVCFCGPFCFLVSLFEGPGQIEAEKIDAVMWRAAGVDFMVFFRKATRFVEIHPVPDRPGYVSKNRNVESLVGRRFGEAILTVRDRDNFLQTSQSFTDREEAFKAFVDLARGFKSS